MSKVLDMLRGTNLYQAMLEQVPEDQREAAVRALEAQLAPYESLLHALPSNAVDNFMKSLNKTTETGGMPTAQSERRPPRRF